MMIFVVIGGPPLSDVWTFLQAKIMVIFAHLKLETSSRIEIVCDRDFFVQRRGLMLLFEVRFIFALTGQNGLEADGSIWTPADIVEVCQDIRLEMVPAGRQRAPPTAIHRYLYIMTTK